MSGAAVRAGPHAGCREAGAEQSPGAPQQAEGERPLFRATSLRSKLYRLWNNAVNTQVPRLARIC
jgi:hypothetical protein